MHLICRSTSASPGVTAPHECTVIPPMLDAAIPVEAVTATTCGVFACLRCSAEMIARSRCDLPVPVQVQGTGQISIYAHVEREADSPAAPVKNTFFPSSTTILSTPICSSFSTMFCPPRVALSFLLLLPLSPRSEPLISISLVDASGGLLVLESGLEVEVEVEVELEVLGVVAGVEDDVTGTRGLKNASRVLRLLLGSSLSTPSVFLVFVEESDLRFFDADDAVAAGMVLFGSGYNCACYNR